MKKILLLLCILSSISNFGCQSKPIEQFDSLKVGMTKADVLESLGSPRRIDRRQGQDRWTYEMIKEQNQELRELRFSEGRLTYLGPYQSPQVSADEIDRKNEASNLALEKQREEERVADKKRASERFDFGGPKTDEERFVPKFEPVQ